MKTALSVALFVALVGCGPVLVEPEVPLDVSKIEKAYLYSPGFTFHRCCSGPYFETIAIAVELEYPEYELLRISHVDGKDSGPEYFSVYMRKKAEEKE